MPTINVVNSSATMDSWRLVLNQIIANTNLMLETNFITSGNIEVSVAADAKAINVVRGYISGNGSQISSVPNTSILSGITNDRLNTNSVIILSGAGLEGGGLLLLGNTVAFNVVPVDSITNTRTDLAASANSVVFALAQANSAGKANATLITTGIMGTTVGGTGKTSYSTNGMLLIGNSQSGQLDSSTLTTANGISISADKQSINLSMNLIQGAGMNLSYSGNSGITIEANGTINASTTGTSGIIRLVDDFNTPNPNVGVTANAVAALSDRIVTNPPLIQSSNNYGRFIQSDIFIGVNGVEKTFEYAVPANLGFLIITAVGQGGGGAAANSLGAGNTGNWSFGYPGGAASMLRIMVPAFLCNTSVPGGRIYIRLHDGAGGAPTNGLGGTPNTTEQSSGGREGYSGGYAQVAKTNSSGNMSNNICQVIGGEGGSAQNHDSYGGSNWEKSNAYIMIDSAQVVGIDTGDVNANCTILLYSPRRGPASTLGFIAGRMLATRNVAVMGSGGTVPGVPGTPGQGFSTSGISGDSANAAGSYGGSDAYGFGHGGGGSLTISRGPGMKGGNGAPALVIIEAYSNV